MPFRSLAEAEAALVEAGAEQIEPEAPRKRGRRG